MKITYDVTRADLFALRTLYQSRRSGRCQLLVEYSTMLGAACVVVLVFVYLVRDMRPDLRLPHTLLLLLGTVVVCTPVYMYLLRRADFRFVEAAAGAASGPHEMLLDATGIHETSRNGSAFHRWTAVQEVHDCPQHVFIVVVSDAAYTVPKRSLMGDTTSASFVETLQKLRSADGAAAVAGSVSLPSQG